MVTAVNLYEFTDTGTSVTRLHVAYVEPTDWPESSAYEQSFFGKMYAVNLRQLFTGKCRGEVGIMSARMRPVPEAVGCCWAYHDYSWSWQAALLHNNAQADVDTDDRIYPSAARPSVRSVANDFEAVDFFHGEHPGVMYSDLLRWQIEYAG